MSFFWLTHSHSHCARLAHKLPGKPTRFVRTLVGSPRNLLPCANVDRKSIERERERELECLRRALKEANPQEQARGVM